MLHPVAVPSPLPVSMVIQGWPPVVGGAQQQLRQLAPRLAEHDIAVTVVTRWAPGLARHEGADGHELRRVGNGWGSPAASARFLAAGTTALVRARPRAIHAHDLLSAALCGALAATLLRVPLVAKVASTGPGGDVDVLLRRPGGARRLRALVRRVDAFACVADEVVDELVALGVPAQRCVLLPNGVDLARFVPAAGPPERAAARAALGLPADGLLVLFCGRLREVKRLDVLADACRAAGATLVLVGEGPLAGPLAARGQTVVRPPVADVGPYLRAADLYGSASATEGLSNAMLEAMACGVPVAAVPASGVTRLLASGGGRVSDGDDAGALAAAITALARPEARERAARAARTHVLARHDIDRGAAALARLYRELATGSRGAATKSAGEPTWARMRRGSDDAVMRRTS